MIDALGCQVVIIDKQPNGRLLNKVKTKQNDLFLF